MKIILNGRPHVLEQSLTLADLLSVLGVSRAKIAVERNLEIVPKSAFDAVVLEDGDKLEIVQFVGGG